MLTRIYGTAFFSKKDLNAHLERIEQARANDHRRLGPELGLFTFREESPGMPFWLPQGTVLLKLIRERVDAQLAKRGYQEIRTPEVLDVDLWHRSGHYENYRENMYFAEPAERDREEEGRHFALKPMNCPGACLVFDSSRHSYRDLPLRLAEYGSVSRFERAGVLHGLLRVRAFTQDDAHVYCMPEHIEDEVIDICEAIDELYTEFGFTDVRLELSTKPEKSIGSDEDWEQAEKALSDALERLGRDYQLNPGDGAFYGPKIDFHVTDALGRSWQLGTCQLDFQMPERFDLTYQGADNASHRPVMIHRALLGSMERFCGILIEHHGGRFPDWLAPTQAALLPVADRHVEAAEGLRAELVAAGVRASIDDRTESVGRKIRDAELSKVPYMLVVGDREIEAGGAAVRSHADGDLGVLGRGAAPIAWRPPGAVDASVAYRPSRLYTAPQCKSPKPRRAAERPCTCASLFRPLSLRLDALPRPRSLVPVPRRFDRRPPERDQTRINERIRVPKVRLIGADGEQVGVLDTDEARRIAREADLDLVEVAPDSRPPVCRLLDYSKYKYELEQKAKQARKHQQQVNVREIKLRPKIADHDYETKKGHVERFLKKKDKVKVTIMFRGREQAHPERGRALLERLHGDLGELATVEQSPQQEGRNMHMVLAPGKVADEQPTEAEPAAQS